LFELCSNCSNCVRIVFEPECVFELFCSCLIIKLQRTFGTARLISWVHMYNVDVFLVTNVHNRGVIEGPPEAMLKCYYGCKIYDWTVKNEVSALNKKNCQRGSLLSM
jgi:hypothetical protein